jgi:hypothetical protein
MLNLLYIFNLHTNVVPSVNCRNVMQWDSEADTVSKTRLQ